SSFAFGTRGERAGRLVPVAAQPVGDQADLFWIEDSFVAEGRHAIVSFAIEGRVRRIADESDQPGARAVTGKVGGGGVRVFLAELMAIAALHFRFNEVAAFFNDRGITLV